MTRLISSVFRHDPAPRFLVEELKSIYDPNGGYFSEGSYIPSLAADIGRVIEKHLMKLGIITPKDRNSPGKPFPSSHPESNSAASAAANSFSSADGSRQQPQSHAMQDDGMLICPYCNERKLVMQENCMKCLACGHSKCG